MLHRFGRRRRKDQKEPAEELQAAAPQPEDTPAAPESSPVPEAGETDRPAWHIADETQPIADGPALTESAAVAEGEEAPAADALTVSPTSSPAESADPEILSLLSTLLRLHGTADTTSLADAAAQLARTYLHGSHLLVLLVDKGGSFQLQPSKSAAGRTLVEQLSDRLGIDLACESPPTPHGRMAKIWLEDSSRAQVVSLADIWGEVAGTETCQRAEDALGVSQITAVRLASPDEPLGIALFVSYDHTPDPAMVDAIGRHLTLALANLRSVEQARQFGSVDPIRWIPDRSEFTRQLSREVNRARRYGHPVSVALLMVDNFDSLRLEFGWTVANRLLRAASSSLAGRLRESDLLGSYRHDGFGVILTQTPAEAASDTANRLRETAAGVRVLEGTEGPVPECVVATASYPEDGSDADALLVAAESRLLPKRRLASASA